MNRKKEQAIKAKEKGNELYKARRFEEALRCYKEACVLDPTNIIFFTNIAAAHFELAKYNKCVKACEAAVAVGFSNNADADKISRAFLRMASAYEKLDDLLGAREAYHRALMFHHTPQTLKKLYALDKQLFTKLDSEVRNLADGKSMESNEDAEIDADPRAALKRYSDAIEKNPHNGKLLMKRAACYRKLAEKDLETCREVNPRLGDEYVIKGLRLLDLECPMEAFKQFEKALDFDPDSKEAFDGLRRCIMVPVLNLIEFQKMMKSSPLLTLLMDNPLSSSLLHDVHENPFKLGMFMDILELCLQANRFKI